MMLYYYCRFVLDTGGTRDTVIPSDSYISLLQSVESFDGTLVKVKQVSKRHFYMSVSDSIFFFTYLREFLNAGIPFIDAMDTIVDETRKINIKAIAARLKYEISIGHLFSDAMKNQGTVFSPITISLIAASEKMNTVSDACNHIVHYLEFNTMIVKKVRSAITYPVFMFVIVFGMIVFYSKFVIPRLEGVFSNLGSHTALPIQTRMLVSFASFISNYWMYTLFICIFVPVITRVMYVFSEKARYHIDSLALHIPIVSGIILKSQFSRFSLFAANMYEKGYNFLDSITESLVVITNTRLNQDLRDVIQNVKLGDTVYRSLRKIPCIPRFVHRMFRVAESTSNVKRPLYTIYEFYLSEVQESLEDIVRFIRPAAILVLGLLMIWIVTATLLPFYSQLPTIVSDISK